MKAGSKTPDAERLTFWNELSTSIIFRELERYHIDTIFEPIAFTTGASGYFKLQNIRVIANDMSLFMYVRGKGLLENNHFEIPVDIQKALTDSSIRLPFPEHYRNLGGKWLTDEERKWLEFWRAEINEIHDEYVRALVETAVSLVIDSWITAKRFGETSAWSPPAFLSYYITRLNQSLLDNSQSNEMWWTNPKELTEKVIADVMFINPPPLKGYAALGIREQIIESWLRGMDDFPLSRIAPKGVLGSVFNDSDDYKKALKEQLLAAEHINLWAFALSNRQPFTRLEFGELLGSLGRRSREIDLKITRQFFSSRAVDTIVIAAK